VQEDISAGFLSVWMAAVSVGRASLKIDSGQLGLAKSDLWGPERVVLPSVGKARRNQGCSTSATLQSDAFPHRLRKHAASLSFWGRCNLALSVLFASPAKQPSAADIGKERLRVVLFSDRAELSPEVYDDLRESVVRALSAYVEISDEEDVNMSVSAVPDMGTVFSVTVPVKRLKRQGLEETEELELAS